eukprot:1281914-Prymnesium_polylepis.1
MTAESEPPCSAKLSIGARLHASAAARTTAAAYIQPAPSEQPCSAKVTIGARLRASAAARTTAAADVQPALPLASVRIAFWSGHLSERGTDTALYDYADCGEKELGIVAYILYDTGSPNNFAGCTDQFRSRFGARLIGVDGFSGVDEQLARHQIAHLYMIKIVNDQERVSRLPGVRTLIHAVFYGEGGAHGDVYAAAGLEPFGCRSHTSVNPLHSGVRVGSAGV